MRGKPFYPVSDFSFRRIIPAHAGQTRPVAEEYRGDSGSSPRMRGKRDDAVDDIEPIRIIPAHAGQTFPMR